MRAARLLVAVTFIVALAIPASAQTIIAQHDYSGGTSYSGVAFWPDYVIAQTFVATTTATVGSIDVTVQKWSPTAVPVSFEIRSVWDSGANGWQPDFSVPALSTGSVSPDDPQWSDWTDLWINVPMTPYELQAGERYAIVATAHGSATWDIQPYVWLIAGGVPDYADGNVLEGFAGDTILATQDRDAPFRVNAVTSTPVGVDIKPGAWPNKVNLKSKGLLSVAVLSTADVDATTIDPSTIEFGDPALTGVAVPVRSSWEDVNLDGLMDLVLKFSVPTLVANGAIDAASEELVLVGKTYDGDAVEGGDAIVAKQ